MLFKNMPFGLVMDGAETISANPFDGIIGLGRWLMSPEQTQPVLYTVYRQGRMSRKFGFQFQDGGGSFWMGENPKQISANDVTYVNVIDGPYWETRVSWIFIFKTGFSAHNHRMIFDTGTHEIHLPGDIHMAINEALGIGRPINRVYEFDCRRLPFLPPITFQIERKMFQIMPKQYTSLTTTNGDTTCRTLFYSTSADCPVGVILGMSFLHSFQLIFDDNAGKVGFAARSEKSLIFDAEWK
ncbi:Lysosomal aspartic protease [Clonorchis sinensis]|uniref:Lysosomal aspartic protease n=1 Tax=Clonorchis sinensis TaxID=79923 RepID=A0A419PX53_CLOSI|nr:Lysosomal aspartic protease [Clonorchis sinensis]